MFLAPSCSDLGESLLITTLLGIPLGEPDGKTPTRCELDRLELDPVTFLNTFENFFPTFLMPDIAAYKHNQTLGRIT